MKVLMIFLFISFGLININKAQYNGTLEGEYLRKPVPYRYVREADVMWSKTIWRIIDLREKINLPLYYPTTKMDNRLSLIDLLLYGIKSEELIVYTPDENDEFKTKMTWQQIEEKFGVSNDTFYVDDPETGESVQKVIKKEMETSEVKQIMIKELWFFDKQSSQFEVRIIGICPIRIYERSETSSENEGENEESDVVMKKLFWVNFPSARFLFANRYVFNPFNDSERRSFDDIFFKRRFSSYIYKESNVFDNRSIGEYKLGLDALLESKKIQDELFVFEHDLWEY